MTTHRRHSNAGFTSEDVLEFPDDGLRREIMDGSLVVTPPPALPHAQTTANLRDRLYDQAPKQFRVVEATGVYPDERNFFIPDLIVVPREALAKDAIGVRPHEALLVVEVVSPSHPSNDVVFKRAVYARHGIREYWIARRRNSSLTILQLAADGKYAERAVVRPGQTWRADYPFPLEVDPAEIF